MHLISVRQIKNNKWSRDKVDDDQPQFCHVPGSSFELADVTPIADQAAAVQAIVDDAKEKMPASPMIVLFVHGYNNSVKSAGATAQRVAAALDAAGVEPATVLLSWPTDARIDRYPSDRNDARNCALVVSRALGHFVAHPEIASGQVALSIFSHSMGNYLMGQAAIRMEADGSHSRLCANVCLVAPDLDRDDLEPGKEADAFCRIAKQVTCYHSGFDGVLFFAQLLVHKNKDRLGHKGPRNLAKLSPNTVSVSCSDIVRAHTHDPIGGAIQVGLEVHSGYFTEPIFFTDLALVLRGRGPAGLATRTAGSTGNSWRLQRPA